MNSMLSYRKPYLFSTLLAVVFLLSACSQEEEQQQRKMPPPAVSVIQVTTQDVGDYQEFVARTEAVDTVELRARVEGFLTKREFIEGQTVNGNQLLFEIDRKPYMASLRKAEADLASSKADKVKAEKDLIRSKDLYKKGHISQADLDAQTSNQARSAASVQAAEAGLETAQLNLGYTLIYAPFKGQIGKARYSIGNLVGASSEPLATLTSVDPIYVNFQVDEKQLVSHLQKNAGNRDSGDQFNMSLRLPNGQNYDQAGRFNFADTRVDETTGTLTLRASFPNPDGILFPGLYVTLISESQDTTKLSVIPQAAVQENQSGRFVLVVNADNQVETRQLVMGRRLNAMWAVKTGLNTGESIIVDGLQKARPGATVNPVIVKIDPATGAIERTPQRQQSVQEK